MSIKICFFAIMCVVVASVIKHFRPDFLPFVRIGATVAVSALAVSVIAPLVTYLN